jgi:hypothetical protein
LGGVGRGRVFLSITAGSGYLINFFKKIFPKDHCRVWVFEKIKIKEPSVPVISRTSNRVGFHERTGKTTGSFF